MKKSLLLSCGNWIALLGVTAVSFASCSLEEVCHDDEKMCVVCADADCSQLTGQVIRNDSFDSACALYLCGNGKFSQVDDPSDGKAVICKNGFTGELCRDECDVGERRCTPDNAMDCKIQECKQNQWKQWDYTGNSCANGFNDIGKTCNDECIPKDVDCELVKSDVDGGEKHDINSCRIKICNDDGKWEFQNAICVDGFNNDKNLCKESECMNVGSLDPDNSNRKCSKDINNAWKLVYEECLFGFKDNSDECKDPCEISNRLNGKKILGVEMTNKDVSIEHIFECDHDGWRESSCGNVDFQREKVGAEYDKLNESEIETIKSYYSKSLREKMNGVENVVYYYGKCGDCGKDTSPDYCVKLGNNKYVNHQCDNGEIKVDSKDKCEVVNNENDEKDKICTDNDGQNVIVDKMTNRYHCGECGHVCGSNEKCNGGCQSIYDCKEGEYVRVDIGTRWVNAYCVTNEDTLKNVRDAVNKGEVYPAYNYDNAYILGDDIDVSKDEWVPIGDWSSIDNVYKDYNWVRNISDESEIKGNVAFMGIFLGNGHSVTVGRFKVGIGTGLFGYVKNAVIQAMIVKVRGSADDKLDLNLNVGMSFGFFAGNVANSTIQSVTVKPADDKSIIDKRIVLSNQTFCKGGECRSATQTTEMNSNAKLLYHHIGGMIGFLSSGCTVEHSAVESVKFVVTQNTTDELACAEQCNGKTASMIRIGGMIGDSDYYAEKESRISNCAVSNITIQDDDSQSDSLYKYGTFYAGGVIGQAQNITVENFSVINSEINFNHEGIHRVGGGCGYAANSTWITGAINNVRVDVKKQSDGVGGGIGRISNTSVIDVKVIKSENDTNEENNEVTSVKYVGGLIGAATNSNVLRCDVELDSVSDDSDPGVIDAPFFGGLIGLANDVSIMDSDVSVGTVSGGVWIGGLAGGAEKNLIISGAHVNANSIHGKKWGVGGIVGYAYKNVTVTDSGVIYSVIDADLNVAGGIIGWGGGITIDRCYAEGGVINAVQQAASMVGTLYNNENDAGMSHIRDSWAVSNLKKPMFLIGNVRPAVKVSMNRLMEIVKYNNDSSNDNYDVNLFMLNSYRYNGNGNGGRMWYLDDSSMNVSSWNYSVELESKGCNSEFCEMIEIDDYAQNGECVCVCPYINQKKAVCVKYDKDSAYDVPIDNGDCAALNNYEKVLGEITQNCELYKCETAGETTVVQCTNKLSDTMCENCMGEHISIEGCSLEKDESCKCGDLYKYVCSNNEEVVCDELLNVDWSDVNVDYCSKEQFRKYFDPKNKCEDVSNDLMCIWLNHLPEKLSLPSNELDVLFNDSAKYVVKPSFCGES